MWSWLKAKEPQCTNLISALLDHIIDSDFKNFGVAYILIPWTRLTDRPKSSIPYKGLRAAPKNVSVVVPRGMSKFVAASIAGKEFPVFRCISC